MDEQSAVTVDEILEALRNYRGVYEREMVDAAIANQVMVIPRLVDVLHNVISNPTPYIENEKLYDHIYAVMLLGHLKVSEAHGAIIELFSLPDEVISPIFGEITTSDLPVILLRTCGGSLDAIKAMALDRQVYDYCRLSALQAMVFAVVEGIAAREEVLDFFGTLFTGQEADSDSDFWGILAINVLELFPEEIMDTITRAYRNNLISPGMVALEDFEDALSRGKANTLARLNANYDRHALDDIHENMSWWASFHEDDDKELSREDWDWPSVTPVLSPGGSAKKKKTKAKKQKRKQANAARRKNRR